MIKRELIVFLIVGALTVLVDFLSYRALIELNILDISMSKATGFIAGTLFAYAANRFWTFAHAHHLPGSAWRFIVLYAGTLGLNVFINFLALRLLVDASLSIQLAFLAATSVSACLNFIGMKVFVFKASRAPELQ